MRYGYIPILRSKRGELDGLRRVRPEMREKIRPLIIVLESTYSGSKPKKSRPSPMSASMVLATAISKAWSDSPFFLDASQLVATHGAAVLNAIVASCVQAGLRPIPAGTLDADPRYVDAVASDVSSRQFGAALRVTLREAFTIEGHLAKWPVPPDETDLIVDLRDGADEARATEDSVRRILEKVCRAGSWRSVTLAGTSMPENFAGMSPGMHELERHEWKLWSRIASSGLPRAVDYGDYATVPFHLADVPPYANFSVNVRYTLKEAFLVRRGVPFRGKTGQPMSDQLRSHARQISRYPNRDPIPGCWADTEIDRIASGSGSAGNLRTWVAIGICRHIERVRTDLP